ncbi:MAG: HD family hydrolase [Pseudomonadota bacterium]
MLSGRRLDLLDPSPLDVEIEDIAQGLSRVARWNGQTSGPHPLSVAEHSLIVEYIRGRMRPAPTAEERLAALLHDAPEYVIGDMISPFKAALGIDYRAFEARLARAVHLRFGLPASLPEAWEARIKKADRLSAWFEATQLAGFSPSEAARFFPRPRAVWAADLVIEPAAADLVRARFVERFQALSAMMAGAAGTRGGGR